MFTNVEKTFLELHKEIWNIASDTSLSQAELIQKILDTIGPATNISRVCYNPIIEENKEKHMICELEWLNEGISSTIGNKTPNMLIKHFTDKYFTELTVESALELVPAIIRPVVKPLIKNFAEKEDLKSISIFPLKIDNELKGWFTLDNCISDHKEHFLSDEIFELMDDVIKIVTLHIEKKGTEERLKSLNKHLEEKVSERTEEIYKQNRQLILQDEQINRKNQMLETSLEILLHDTRNIFSNLYVILEEIKETKDYDRLKENIDELFDLITESAGMLQTKKYIMPVSEMIKGIKLEELRTKLEKHQRIELFIPENFEYCIEATALFKNTIENIIENALKYSSTKEKVKVELKYYDSKIAFIITDKGSGIPDQLKQKVFEREFRMENHLSKNGTGKGLWITRNLIDEEGGTLKIENNKPNGSIFTIEIPVYKTNSIENTALILSSWFNIPVEEVEKKADSIKTVIMLNGEQPEPDMETAVFARLLSLLHQEKDRQFPSDLEIKLENLRKANPQGPKILLCDDSLYVHYYLAKYLTQEGYRICGNAKNGLEALHMFKIHEPELIFMDYTMPKMDGIDAAKNIYEKNNQQKIIFLTAAGEMKSVVEAIESFFPAETTAIINKPAEKDLIVNTVKKLL